MGEVELAPHQLDAVTRIRSAIAEFGGAFLCDAVGVGKTYVGLALAREMTHPLVVAPAALRDMWVSAMQTSSVRCSVVTTESLSRWVPNIEHCDCVIVDEAHHFRNKATRRHHALSTFGADRPVLLITATPIHNSRRDLESLASLFLGVKSLHLSETELSRLIVRREKKDIAFSARIPNVGETEWMASGDCPDLVNALMALPPPVPFREAGTAGQLAALGLLRQLASSEAALAAALKRRLARGIALEASLAAGEYPSGREMRSWISEDDAVQLGFPGLLEPQSHGADLECMLAAVRDHDSALRELIALLGSRRHLDETKCDRLTALLGEFPNQPVIAFASYEATVISFFKRLSRHGHIAAMTSRGGRIASGSIAKRDIERQFAPDSPPEGESTRIDLLLTTDLLSEGVNLQRAACVIHLDIPWTAARMDQRVGRIARIGSRHNAVRIVGFRPPPSCERILRGASIVSTKWRIASAAIGTGYDHGLDGAPDLPGKPVSEIHESLRGILREWQSAEPMECGDLPLAAAVAANRSGFLALLDENGSPLLIAGNRDSISESIEEVRRMAMEARGPDLALDRAWVDTVFGILHAWLSARESKRVAGLADGTFLSRRRRVFSQINSIAARLPLHQRIEEESVVARARRFASSIHGAGVERSLRGVRADIGSLEPLGAGEPGFHRAERGAPRYRVRALLILVVPTPALSS